MKKFVLGTLAAIAVAGLMQVSAPEAQARKQYADAFTAEYPDYKVEKKCNLCHVGKEKKNRNDYGKAAGKAIGAKNCKDPAVIKEGLEKAAGEKSTVEGKTWGDLIKENALPVTE